MRLLIAFLFSIVLFSSCGTTYYYAQMKANDPYTDKDSIGNFIMEDDSIRIMYSFHGENAPVKISVKNKMKKNLYIDWEESFFIFGDNDENRLNISQYMEPWEKKERVKGNSESTKSLFELSNLRFDKIDDLSFKKKKITKADGKTIKLKSIDYTEEDTPLYMKSTLVLHMNKVGEETLYFDQDFYITNLTKAHNVSPKKLAAYANKQGDSFYTRINHGRKFKQFLQVTGDVLVVTGEVLEIILSNTVEE